MRRINIAWIIAFLISAAAAPPLFSQIVFQSLPDYKVSSEQLDYMASSSQRRIIVLNGNWQVYNSEDDKRQLVDVVVPSVFQGDALLVFTKKFGIKKADLENYHFELFILGLEYEAEILINGSQVYRHTGGKFPFSFTLPKDLLTVDGENELAVKLDPSLSAEKTIPLKQGLLQPAHFGGIHRDVFLVLKPNTFLKDFSVSYTFPESEEDLQVSVETVIENSNYRLAGDTIARGDDFEIRAVLESDYHIDPEYNAEPLMVSVPLGKEKPASLQFTLNEPHLWSPQNPVYYSVTVQLLQDGIVIDELKKNTGFYNLQSVRDSLILNGSSFSLTGVTYIPSNGEYGDLMTYEQIEKDVRLMKSMGFNAVFFNRVLPHPYMLHLFEKYGLLAFIEIPIYYLPETIAESELFSAYAKNYIDQVSRAYGHFTSVAAIGLGKGYDGTSAIHQSFIQSLAEIVKEKTNILTTATFRMGDIQPVSALDLYGIGFFTIPIGEGVKEYEQLQESIGKGKVFIADAGYLANPIQSNGYTNPHSFDAQAKYFEEFLTYAEDFPHTGFFLHTMFDYRCDYHSIVTGYQEDRNVYLGILGEDRNTNTNRLSYKIIDYKIFNKEKVTIPLGEQDDDAPMVFILFGLGLAIVLGFLVNSGRKFREDATRALLRPYNFFADIRDLRIISGLQTSVLAFIIAAVLALISSSLLYSLKYNILFEKIIVAFGSNSMTNLVSFITWHPVYALLYLTVSYFIALMLLTLLIKLMSFFVMNRVLLGNAYYTVIWSMLPYVLLIPLAIVLYRIINTEALTIYLYLGLLLFSLVVLYRLLKGVYVIYDVNPRSVFIYSILLILTVSGAVLLYFQMADSAVDYLIQVFKEIKIS